MFTRIGVSMRMVVQEAYCEPRDLLSHDMIAFTESLGITPILIPNSLDSLSSHLSGLELSGILLSGGNNVCPQRYGRGDLKVDDCFEQRDRTEASLLDWAIENKLPVLGTCRGMQMINVYFGGRLCTEINAGGIGPNHIAANHSVKLDPNVCPIPAPAEITVNSYHRQGLHAAELAECLDAFAVCEPDGVIEAFIHREHPIAGVQWHPERPGISGEFDRAFLGDLFHTCLCQG